MNKNFVICLLLQLSVFFSCSLKNTSSGKASCLGEQTIDYIEKITDNYIIEQVKQLDGDVVVKTQISVMNDSEIQLIIGVSALPFKDEKMPFYWKKIEDNGRMIVSVFYSDVHQVDDISVQEKLKKEELIIWVDKNGKWLIPFKNNHSPNDYISWFVSMCCKDLKHKIVRSSYKIESIDYPIISCKSFGEN